MFLLELLSSFLVLTQILFYGQKSILGPILGIAAALAFIIYMILASAWGFLPMNVVGLGLHCYNLYLWRKTS
jgi:hypothetical protein